MTKYVLAPDSCDVPARFLTGLIVRSTKAINAVERLKTRSGNPHYAAVSLSGGLFYLVDRAASGEQKLSAPQTMDDFVAFVNALKPEKPRRVSKLDLAMDEQIKRSGKLRTAEDE